MMKLRSVTAGALATAMLATSVTPAVAQGYPGYGYGRPGYGVQYDRYRHRRNHDNTGAVVAGVIGVGILAAIIASAASNKNRTSNSGYANTGNIRTDDQAADACASAAEQQLGGSARVSAVTSVNRVSDGFNVRGDVDYGRSNTNDRYGNSYDQRSFSCSIRYGNVQRVDFGG